VVRVTDPSGRISRFSRQEPLLFYQVAPQFLLTRLSAPRSRPVVGCKTPWPESASELYRPSDRRLLAKLVSTFVNRGCHVVSVTDSYGHILEFLGRSSYFFFQVVVELLDRKVAAPV
jgi:hypothetical protein